MGTGGVMRHRTCRNVLVVSAGLLSSVRRLPARSTAHGTSLVTVFLQAYGLYFRTGSWEIYSFPGSPFGFNLGTGFSVGQVCQPSGSGGVFLSAGQGFG